MARALPEALAGPLQSARRPARGAEADPEAARARQEQGREPMTSSGRSVWAVFAGFLVVVVLSTGTDAVMHATGVFPPFGEPMSDGRFLLATAYRIVYAILGS